MRAFESFARRGFTLVELLVVIAIIGVMVAMTLPAVQASREAARRIACTRNMARLMIGVSSYQASQERLPAGVINPTGPIKSVPHGQHHSWTIALLPHLDEGNIYRHVDQTASVYDEQNAAVRRLLPRAFICPSEAEIENSGSNYAGCHHPTEAPIDADNGGVLFLNSAVGELDIPDGAAHTIFLGEKIVDPDDLGWMSGTRATLRNTGTTMNAHFLMPAAELDPAESEQPADNAVPDQAQRAAPHEESKPPTASAAYVGGFGSYHPGGAIFGFGDGNVQFLSDEIDPTLYRLLGGRADGQLVDDRQLR